MQRVKRYDLKSRIAVAFVINGKIKVQDYTDDLKSPKEQVIAHLVELALDQVYANDAVVIRPNNGRPLIESAVGRDPGGWDVSEPWPEAFGPKPTRPQDI